MEEDNPKQDNAGEPPVEPSSGEDHREGPPGYDLDEQAAIEALRRERDEQD